jgi:hypothetical protein
MDRSRKMIFGQKEFCSVFYNLYNNVFTSYQTTLE